MPSAAEILAVVRTAPIPDADPAAASHSSAPPQPPDETPADRSTPEPVTAATADQPATELERRAEETATDSSWDPDSDSLRDARNAHHTNTAEEMRAAIDGPYDWFEGDLRVHADGALVMAHDAHEEDEGLTLTQWLTVGAASDRGMKVDVKEDEALPGLLDALEQSGIEQGRMMINIAVAQDGGDGLSTEDVAAIRHRFPQAWIAINPADADTYDMAARKAMIAAAEAAGGRITFPLQWDLATDRAIEELGRYGSISIWTSATFGTPGDQAAAAARLRERGVDGMIDMGTSSWATRELVQPALRTASTIFGRSAVNKFLAAGESAGSDAASGWGLLSLLAGGPAGLMGYVGVTNGPELASAALDGASHALGRVVDGYEDAPGAIKDAADSALDFVDDAPLIGGLF